ncbi:translation initiation factor [Gayadomonas joobiniege]|uniref:translation initiation factor n=1 Tax=Gayadomonas joobiniege TaxID=1234606 RepID=UPI000370146C|nr:translation initiation factor [Gayadomonas joobiniege]
MTLVYSTDKGRIEQPKEVAKAEVYSDGYVRIRRETSGRKGKGVITVRGIDADAKEIKKIGQLLKKKCGTGGSVKDGVIEIQGDKRDLIKSELEKLGYKVKLAGG